MARECPTTERAFANITGVGTKKLEEFGAQFMDAILKYLRENPRQVFSDSLRPLSGPAPRPVAKDSSRASWDLFAAGKSPEEVARLRRILAGEHDVIPRLDGRGGTTCGPRMALTKFWDPVSEFE